MTFEPNHAGGTRAMGVEIGGLGLAGVVRELHHLADESTNSIGFASELNANRITGWPSGRGGRSSRLRISIAGSRCGRAD